MKRPNLDNIEENPDEDLISGQSKMTAGGVDTKKLALNLNLVSKGAEDSRIAEAKEKLYDDYTSNSSKRGLKPAEAVPRLPLEKPKFNLNLGKVTGEQPDNEETFTGNGAVGDSPPKRNIMQLGDQISEIS
jgi:hypothetical protein